jgi:hypothetical protein
VRAHGDGFLARRYEGGVDGLRARAWVDAGDEVLQAQVDRERIAAAVEVERVVDGFLAGRDEDLAVAALDR